MTGLVYGGAAGVTTSSLIVAVGIEATAWIVLALSVLAIVVGAVDYVRTHG